MVTARLPKPVPELGAKCRVPPPKGGLLESPAAVQVTLLAAATWNVVVTVPPVQLPADPSVTERGVTALTTGVATVRVVLPEMLPDLAVIVDEPAPTPDASPEPLTVATDVVPDVQVDSDVTSWVVLSE